MIRLFRLVLPPQALAAVILFLPVGSSGQNLSSRAAAYKGGTTPLSWHNRKPHAAYWQQDVHYTISARIDEAEHSIAGTETLEYVNNSPDTLREIYFHLYQDAFIAGSYLRQLEKANGVKAKLGKREAAGLGIVIRGVHEGNDTLELPHFADMHFGSQLIVNPDDIIIDNTLMRVGLRTPLPPGEARTLTLFFETYWDRGSTRRRMQMYPAWGWMHYNGCQWYPKACVYDAHSGWNLDQHLGKEFYGDFGTFDVTLDFPSNYVVEATGALQNRSEVLPDTLRKKLDMANFKTKKWNDTPSTITPYTKGERKRWHFLAENVHDFAFTADPSYRIATAYWNGVECVGIAQEPHASGWQNSAQLVAKIVQTFSEDIGPYAYPKMVAADANDGMEYPMITMDGGSEPGYRGLLIHEIGHNWFYGMVGSNETYRAALDEGFTQFLTAWGLRKIDGDTVRTAKPKGWYRRRFAPEPQTVLDRTVVNAYVADAVNQTELPLETHSDNFHSALNHDGGYRQVYYKTATMLYNLQYLLGDSLFQRSMQHYFGQWKMAHPYFDDFKQSMIAFTGLNLNPFFDQWINTTKHLDYAITRVRKGGSITFRRRGEMVAPITFTVEEKSGDRKTYTIPVQWLGGRTEPAGSPLFTDVDALFRKNSGSESSVAFYDRTSHRTGDVLRPWTGWGALNRTYSAHVPSSNIRSVTIDTSRRFADVYALDNTRAPGLAISNAVRLRLDGGLSQPASRHHYQLWWRPDLWWNPVDGVKAGLHLEGSYGAAAFHNVDATVWYNTHIGQGDRYLVFENEDYYSRYAPVHYALNYSSPLTRRTPRLRLDLHSRFLDGLHRHSAGLVWNPTAKDAVSFYFLTLWRPNAYASDYLLYPQEWSSYAGRPNASLNVAYSRRVQYRRGVGNYTLAARAPFFAGRGEGAYNYSYVKLEAVNYNTIGKLEVRTRLYGRLGTGGAAPQESLLWLAGAAPEALMEDKYVRTVGFVPDDLYSGGRHDPYARYSFQQGGGLNLRGYADYLVADEKNGEVLLGYKGRSGIGANLEADFDGLIPFRPKWTRNWLHLDLYAFADAGVIELSRYGNINEYWNTTPANTLSDVRMDAGVGTALTIKRFGPFEKARPFTLRVDFPLFLNRPPAGHGQYWDFRYVVGVNRSF